MANPELRDFYCLPYIIGAIKWMRMKSLRQVARVDNMNILVGESDSWERDIFGKIIVNEC
jgi:hypothetical protein